MSDSAPAAISAAGVIGVGIVGLGAAGRAFVPALREHAGFRPVAIADRAPEVRSELRAELGVAAYDSLAAMLSDPGVDAVYVATPTDLHREHATQAFAAGKHVLVEKPMAARLEDARAMIAAAERAGKVLLVGHSHSYDLPIWRMRELIAGGSLGRVRMVHTWCYTDWVYRPRRSEELDRGKGGGVTFRQGSHQFDIIRLLCGGVAKSVRARTFDWDPQRRTIGAHVVYLDFADAAATAVYNGYGHFATMELGFDVSEWGFLQPPETRRPVRAPSAASGTSDEVRAKAERAKRAIPAGAPYQPFFGLTLVSCERGDIRQSPRGLYVYTHEGRAEIDLPSDQSPRDLVVAEFYDALTGNAPAVHDGRWGLANLEICTAAIASAESGREIVLHEQVALPAARTGQ